MVRVMVPPTGTVVSGVNTRTGATVAPENWDARVMEVNAVIVVAAVTVSVVPVTAAVLAPFVKVSSTDDAAAGVAAPITTVTVVALAYVHVAATPVAGAAPTLAVQAKPEMKFVPVTVMVPPADAVVGDIEVAVGLAVTVSVVPATATVLAPFVKVSSTDDAAAGVPVPITTTTVVALAYVHDVAAVPVAGAAPTLAVQAKPEMKFAPVTVMVLPAYAATGAMEASVGSAVTVSVVPETATTLAPPFKLSSTDDATVGVVAPITTTTSVALTYVHDVAATPVAGTAPTLAVQAPARKFAPVTVMVLPTYAATGAIESAVIAAVTVSVVPATAAVLAPFVKVSSTDDATPIGVAAPITTVTVVALAYVHVAATPVAGRAPTLAVQAKPEMKFVPVTVMVPPAD
jgi:hypothetical protein